ncbi:GIY-YIG nuclease family protein [Streptomyces sp. NPDC006872]|uniref:GIY-YIG nuclease family protein n=1 Tax=Streptomyces sp. NPDC006872 TaxID=3155720 RepID=UPI003400C47F
MTEQVYVIGSPGSRIVKIGRSTAPEKRLWTIQVGSPVRLALLATFEGGRVLEEALHCYFGAYQKRGEWFELGNDPIEEVRAAVALGVSRLRAQRPTDPHTAQFGGVNWHDRFPLRVTAVLSAYGVALSPGSDEDVFHQCDASSGCVDCRTGRLVHLCDPDFVVHETSWEGRPWAERFPEVRTA